jgi:hypothetical protein
MRHLHTYITEALRRLGGGEEGVVYDLGNGKVKKVFSRGRVPIPWQLLYQACCAGVDIVALPKVYEIGDDYIIREDCTPNTARCKAFYKTSQYVPFPKSGPETIYRLVLDGYWWYTPEGFGTNICWALKGIVKDTIHFLTHLKYELSQVAGPHAGLGDFALKNLGETKDGRVVLFDF